MDEKTCLRNKIAAYCFAIHETVLYLDTHPSCQRTMAMLDKYRAGKQKAIEEYEQKFGPYVVTVDDVKTGDRWNWIDGPWPWELKGDK